MQLVTFNDIKNNVKNISEHIDEARITNAISEAQQLDVKPLLGEQMYIAIIELNGNYSEDYKILLNGSIYEHNGLKYEFSGLKKALSYFAYARLIKGIDGSVTRSGFMQKDGDFSQHSQTKDKLQAVKDAEITGTIYLQECVDYIKRNSDKFTAFKTCSVKKKVTFKVLGD